MTIGKLAGSAGVPTSTVRFYERAGLLRPEQRTNGNYRDYSLKSLERLRFIKSAQTVGLSVKDIKQLLSLTRKDGPPCRDIEQLLDRRLQDVRQRMRDLRRIERTLANAMKTCCGPKSPGLCETVHKLRDKKNFSKCP